MIFSKIAVRGTEIPDCRVVVVNRNTCDLLARCLDSVKSQMIDVTLKVIVVDNSSTDGSVQMLAEHYPWVEVIEEKNNRGYSAAINTGAYGTSSPYLLIMNPDVEMEPGAVRELVTFLELNPKAAVAGPTLLCPDGSIQRSFNRSFPGMVSLLSYSIGVASLKEKLYRVKLLRKVGAGIFWKSRGPRKVSWVGGACFLIRRETFEELGGMDEEFFLYSEDTDLCKRVNDTGRTVWFIPGARAVHHWNTSIGKLPDSGYFASLESTLCYHQKHHPRTYATVRFLVGTGILARLGSATVLQHIPGCGKSLRENSWRYWEGLELVTGRPVREPLKQAVLKLLLPLRNFLLRLLLPSSCKLDGSRGLTAIRKILILRCDGLGDMVLTMPFFRMIKKAYPHALLYILAGVAGHELLRTDHDVYQVLKVPDTGIKDKLRFIYRLRAESFDLVIDPFITDSISLALLTRCVGRRYRAGFTAPGRERFFNLITPHGDLGRSMLLNLRNLAESLGCRDAHIETRLRGRIVVGPRERQWAREKLSRLGLSPDEPVLGIHPGGRYKSQRWPIERYVRVAGEIMKHGTCRVILLGQREWRCVTGGGERLPEGIVLLEDIGLDRFVAVLGRITLLLCNNSGPLHVARALGVPTVSLAGPTREAFLPRDEESHWICESDAACRPCDKPLCVHHRCLRSIGVDEVVSLIRDRLPRLTGSVEGPVKYKLDRTNG